MHSRPVTLLLAAATCACALAGCSFSTSTSTSDAAAATAAARPVANSSTSPAATSDDTDLPAVACQQAANISREFTKGLRDGVAHGGYGFGSGEGMMLPYAGNMILGSSANLPEQAFDLGRALAGVQDGFVDPEQAQEILDGLDWMEQSCS